MTGWTLTSFPSIRADLRNTGANVVDQEAARDGNLATSRSPDDLFPLFRRGSTVQSTDAGNCS
ncbi:DJ-1/PfpI family protein [Brachybacterium sp. GU-2]|uniref:DJ-1/PfpI family protein n=1 Tax=Brachybacterium sp. GU-2 TaxID=3069708 RepID=UPI00399A3CA0